MEKEKSLLFFYPEDKIAFVFSAVIILIQIYYFVKGALNGIMQIFIPVTALLVLFIFIFAGRKKGPKTVKFLRSYLHIPFYGIIFTAFQSFVHKINPKDYDSFLLNIDLALFKTDLTVRLETYVSKGLTEILTLSYFSYYILPTLTFVILFFAKNTDSFTRARNYLLAIVIGWYGAFIPYVILPAAGPDIAYPSHYSVPLAGLSSLTNTYLQNLAVYLKGSFVRNTFPSMHFGIILVTNYFAFRYKRKYFWLCTLPLGSLLGIATLYLRQHYLIDLIGSFPAAFISIYLALKLNKKFNQ